METDPQTLDAERQLRAWLAGRAGATVDPVQPGRGSTNRVFFVRVHGQRAVYKVFCELERKEREAFALKHWSDTGLVPRLIEDNGKQTLVMGFVPGVYLLQSVAADAEPVWQSAASQTAAALARLVMAPLPARDRNAFESRFYRDLPTLADYLGQIVHLARGVHTRDPDFARPFWRASLEFAASRLPSILAEPMGLYHQDCGNLHVQDGRFCGCFDLEMARVGGASMQLGSLLAYLEDEPRLWQEMKAGWESATGSRLSPDALANALAVHHLLCWRVITRYMSYDGAGRGYDWSEPADPKRYRMSIESVELALAG